ncbi:MAG: gliding motility-associated C-terminal domain-containing protein [Bacteroidales bacterium]|nr:gliding motility-associated C-terminal domain-containing protein [Bacteroidales bacterium]
MNEFDKILKQKLQGYTETPPPEVFENISRNIPKRTVSEFMSAYKYHIVAAVATLGISVALTFAYLSPDAETDTHTPNNTIVENVTPDAPETNELNNIPNPESKVTDAVDNTVTFTSDGPEKIAQPENKTFVLNLNDTSICGNELLIEGLDNNNVKVSDGLSVTKVASGVMLHGNTYGGHTIELPNGRKVKITFVEQEKPVAKVSKTNLCYGEKLQVEVSGTNSFTWDNEGYSAKKVSAGKYELSGLHTGSNPITIKTSGSCSSKVTFDVNVAEKLNYSVSTKPNYCSGKNGELTVKSDGKMNYCRINGSEMSRNGIFTGLNAGIYMLEINYANSCVAYDTVLVRDKTNLNAFFETSRDAFAEKKYNFRNYTRLDDSGNTQNVDFEWLVNGVVITTDYNFEYEFRSSGNYVVELVARTGDCESRYSETIGVTSSDFRIPNVFTPNGDGIGDEFTIMYNGTLLDYDLSIYTKAGQLVFHSQQLDNCWNGKVSGNNDASEGVYFYVITATGENNEKLTQKGTVQLIRR